MAYDEGLARRVRDILADERQIAERRMFGGLAFMAHGHMFVGIVGDTLMARYAVGDPNPMTYEQPTRDARWRSHWRNVHVHPLVRPHAREMDFTGTPMKGYVFVDPPGIAEDETLVEWVIRSHRFVRSLPPKSPGTKKRTRTSK